MDNGYVGDVGVSASLKDCGLTIGNIALPLVHFIYKTAWTLVCDVRDRPHDMTPCHLDSDVTVMITLLSNQYVGLPWPPYLRKIVSLCSEGLNHHLLTSSTWQHGTMVG